MAAGLGQTHAVCPEPAMDASRIVSAGGSVTEIIYALGAESRLVAVDTTSNFPSSAADLPSVGYVRALSTEGMLSTRPTLILGEDDMGPPEVLSQLSSLGIELAVVPERWHGQGIVEKVRCISSIVGVGQGARDALIEKLQNHMDDLSIQRSRIDKPIRVALLLALRDGVPTAAGSETSGHGVLEMAGLTNVFADFEGWKPIAPEAMIKRNPDVIFITERSAKAAGGIEAVIADPIIELTDAGNSGNVFAVDGMALLGFGPRTITTALQISTLAQAND
ncbi:MAG TPA: hemin ABC transporter substrate-binding protein [Gammaproteobacteria bacterium]|nr:hemin ABC transporter substrate-binding protein [Gammaproteobacteria bacterium]